MLKAGRVIRHYLSGWQNMRNLMDRVGDQTLRNIWLNWLHSILAKSQGPVETQLRGAWLEFGRGDNLSLMVYGRKYILFLILSQVSLANCYPLAIYTFCIYSYIYIKILIMAYNLLLWTRSEVMKLSHMSQI